MCGICGIFSNNITDRENSLVKTMNDSIKHRGPDDEGFFADNSVSLGMRRLAIIDLEKGKQPVMNDDGSLILIFNGEIYNYLELRRELELHGITFKTESDTEVLLKSYEIYGDDFLSKLRGMFAFCLYDKKREEALIVRDRMGEKPLYYAEEHGVFYFSSEMKSLMSALKNKTINQKALDMFLTIQFVREPQTLLKEVKKLEAGHLIRYKTRNNTFTIEQYWEPGEGKIPHDIPHKDLIKKTIEETMSIVIRSDVPVGVSLSGGIDSSLVTILGHKYAPDMVNAFTVGYPGEPDNDERQFARDLTKELGIKLHEVEVGTEDFVRDFETMVYALDDPIGDIAAYGYYRVMQKAREENVPVILNGIGGDELFWGYSWMRNSAKLWDKYLRKGLGGSLFRAMHCSKKENLANTHAFDLVCGSYRRNSDVWNSIYTNKFKNQLPKAVLSPSNITPEEFPLPLLEDQFNWWLYPNATALGDRMSMAHSVELRSPLLDYILTEQAVAISMKTKHEHKRPHKELLINAFRDILPKDITKRKKRGFKTPAGAWQSAIIQNFGDRVLNGYAVKEGLLDKKELETILKAAGEKRTSFDIFLYRLILFEVWYKTMFKEVKK